jgi:hypothetical protein
MTLFRLEPLKKNIYIHLYHTKPGTELDAKKETKGYTNTETLL